VSLTACIDVGSNTTRLLVAETSDGRLREVLAERAFTRLGAACGADGSIGAEKAEEIATVVARQVRLADELGAATIRVVATAAVRSAPDRDALAAAVGAAAGVALEVLSEEEEARLAFAGAIGTLPDPPPGPLGVVDVGGGSTELVVGTAVDGVQWSTSLPLGSSTVTVDRLHGDPPAVAELAAARAALARVFAGVSAPVPIAAYAVGGSATSLRRLIGSVLDRDALARGLQALTSRPAEEVALRLGLHAERARLLPAGILLLDAASRALQAPLHMAAGGLREGVILDVPAGPAGAVEGFT
jgi:exopolyphosphatase/guanosine-5'-triphosphate,3'-diphosphate pyrophosphatase